MCQQADYFCSGIVNTAKRGNMRLYLRLKVSRRGEITAAKVRSTELFRVEKSTDVLQKLLRGSTLYAEEKVRCDVCDV